MASKWRLILINNSAGTTIQPCIDRRSRTLITREHLPTFNEPVSVFRLVENISSFSLLHVVLIVDDTLGSLAATSRISTSALLATSLTVFDVPDLSSVNLLLLTRDTLHGRCLFAGTF